MDTPAVEEWLRLYGKAWEERQPEEFVRLFSPDVLYYWTPFEPPRQGREALRRAVELVISTQNNITFQARVLGHTAAGVLAHWSCSFTRSISGSRVHVDGIFLMDFSADGLCHVFREWWHSDEEQR